MLRRILALLASACVLTIFPAIANAEPVVALTTDPSAVSNTAGRIDVFGADATGAVFNRHYERNHWSEWTQLGGGVHTDSRPVGVAWADGSGEQFVSVFIRGTNDRLFQRLYRYSTDTWSPWEVVTNVSISSDPAPVAWGNGNLSVFGRGLDGSLVQACFCNGAWQTEQSLGGGILGTPSAISWRAGHIDVYVRATDNTLYHKIFDNGAWGSWQNVGNETFQGDPHAISWHDGHVDVYVRGTGNNLLHDYHDNGAWAGWASLGGGLTSDPSPAFEVAGHVHVFARDSNGTVQGDSFEGGQAWNGWAPLSGLTVQGAPSAVSWGPGLLSVFARDTNGALWQRFFNNATSTWSAWGVVFPTPYTTSQNYDFDQNGEISGETEMHGLGDAITHAATDADARQLFAELNRADLYRVEQNIANTIPRGQLVRNIDDGAVYWVSDTEHTLHHLTSADYAPTLGWDLASATRITSGVVKWWTIGESITGSNYVSWAYGGTNHSIDTDTEIAAVRTALGDTGYLNGALWDGIRPSDQPRIFPTSWTYGGADHSIDTDAETAAMGNMLDELEETSGYAAAVEGMSPSDQASVLSYDGPAEDSDLVEDAALPDAAASAASAASASASAHQVFKTYDNMYNASAQDVDDNCGDWPNLPYYSQVGRTNGPNRMVLRWGNKRYGYRHIVRKRAYTSLFDSRVRWITSCQPLSFVKHENLYDDVYEGWVHAIKVCKFRVIYSHQIIGQPNDPYKEKGIVTAYPIYNTGC